ncbi:hypothetical protein EZS27_006685 [termite gut metagenome]|uniref:Uncharacterized protein n=1 Tax=termite gut metagenome TaxID=433724 RepID=A0A5J4SHZ9_9ZZZZ
MLGINLKDGHYNKPYTSGWFVEQDFIVRKISTCTVVIQGVKSGEQPELTTMWAVIGYPAVTPAIPVWVKGAERKLPTLLLRDKETKVSPLCYMALQLRNKVYSYKRGTDSERYFNWELLYNANHTGYMQQIYFVEKEVIKKSTALLKAWRERGNIDVTQTYVLYDDLDVFITSKYQELGF